VRKSSFKKEWIYRDLNATIEGPVSGGKGFAQWGLMRVHLKQQSSDPDDCYELFNEAVATELARISGLPVMDQFFVVHESELYSVTPRIDDHGHPPLLDAQLLNKLHSNPRISHGMILFDLWIANNDRRAANIQYGQVSGELYFIDFGNALLYRAQRKGIARLEEMEKHPENLYIEPNKPYEYTNLLYDPEEVGFWCERFLSIPEWMIENVVNRGDQIIHATPSIVEPIPGILKERAFDFLIKRRHLLKLLVTNLANAGIFKYFKVDADTTKKDIDKETKEDD
jgi:hypothetical protein